MTPRIPYDSLTLRAVAAELRPALLGGTVQHVSQPAPHDLVMSVRSRGATRSLALSCDANWPRAHLSVARRPNPPTPPAFCMICRKYLEGGRVASVEQRGFDRILDVRFDGADGREYVLTAELMGKHSNIVLVNETGAILDAAKHVTLRISRHRETLPGRPYVAPPSQDDRQDPFAATAEELAEFEAALPMDPEAQAARWMGHFAGISPFLAGELTARAGRSGAAAAWNSVFGAAARGDWEPVVVRTASGDNIGAYPFPIVQVAAALQFRRDSMNVALDHYYGAAIPRAARDAAVRELEGAIGRALKARERERESLERSLAEARRADEYREAGELLLASLHMVEASADIAVVPDLYGGEGAVRSIALDTRRSPRENAEAYFRRYRKAKDGVDAQRAHLEHVIGEIAALHDAGRRIGSAAEPQDLAALRDLHTELVRAGLLRADRAGAEPAAGGPGDARRPSFGGKKIRAISTPEGWDIYVGENSEANDYLTSRVAGPNDLWFHVRANASAHVVVRTRNEPWSVPQAVLRRAALLAAQHSPAKHSSLVPVDYTLKKYVRRPRGSASGAAVYQNEKTLYVNPSE